MAGRGHDAGRRPDIRRRRPPRDGPFCPRHLGTTLTGQVRGYDSVQYALGVTAGQTLDVQLDGDNSSLYFNVTAAGASAALYNSSIDGNGTSITIPSSGTYLIDVYLMRNAARRNETATYSLTLYVE